MDNDNEKRYKDLSYLWNVDNNNTNKESDNKRICTNCGRRLHRSVVGTLCPMCQEQELFYQVKDYIRENDVKDYDVAAKFNLPLSKVREWIKQGRIQYKNDPTMKQVIMGNYCQVCGLPTSFGTICPRCMREKKKSNIKGVAIGQPQKQGNTKMRFMDDDDKK